VTTVEGFAPWPPHIAARYRLAGLWRGQPLGYWMWRWAQAAEDRTAVVDGPVRLGYLELAERADAVAEALLGLGLRRGDRVLVQLPNRWEFVVLVLAAFRAGVAPILALPAHRRHELTHLAATAEAAAIVVPDVYRGFDHQTLAASVAADVPSIRHVLVVGDAVQPGGTALAALRDPPGDAAARRARLDRVAPGSSDVALFLLSGGTTGLPKLIARTHDDYEYNVRVSAAISELGPDSVYLVALPAAHNFPFGCPGILGTLSCGGRVVMLPSPRPGAAFTAIEAEQVTIISLVPAVARQWVDSLVEAGAVRPGLGSLRVVQVGGSLLDPTLARDIPEVLGARLQQVFGMAEGLLNFTRLDDPSDVLLSTQGRPASPFDEIMVVDEHDQPVPVGVEGELLTRGPYTPRGYFRAPEHNARGYTEDGWYRTGDLVRLRPDGNLVVSGRRKDLINRGGEKIAAAEVETLARELLGLPSVAAVPVADAAVGERVCLVVAGGPRPALAAVRAAFAAHGVARYKIPEAVLPVAEFPVTAVGKIDKLALRQLAEEASRARADNPA
jgi:2,3-dihydroxybenzoate-AMP ligase